MMKIHVQLRNQAADWSSSLPRYSEDKMRRALSRVEHGVEAVQVRIEAVSGRRGRQDCLATVVVYAVHGQRMVLHKRDPNPHRAVAELAHAARRSQCGVLKKQRSQRRKGRQERGGMPRKAV